jgi:hypothetical protein
MKKQLFYLVVLISVNFFLFPGRVFSQDYSKLGNKYNLNLLTQNGKEMKSKVLVPKEKIESVKKFLEELEAYNPSVNETIFLEKINSILSSFSSFRINISNSLSSGDPIKDKILVLYQNTDKGSMKKYPHAIIKIESQWAIINIYHNYSDKYRNFCNTVGYFDSTGSFLITNGTDGSEFLYILDIIENSKGEWE